MYRDFHIFWTLEHLRCLCHYRGQLPRCLVWQGLEAVGGGDEGSSGGAGGPGGLVGQAGGLHGGRNALSEGPLAALPPHVDAVVAGRGGVAEDVGITVVVQGVEGADDDL